MTFRTVVREVALGQGMWASLARTDSGILVAASPINSRLRKVAS